MRRQIRIGAVVFCCAALTAVTLGGCRGQGDGLSDAQKASADRMHDIAAKSGGDWDKLTQAERDEFIKAANGSEPAAKMLFAARSGRLKANPGGATPGGGAGK